MTSAWTGTGTVAAAPSAAATTYCTETDMDNHFGSDNITKWSNLDNTSTSRNDTRVTAAIAYAEGYINDRFRGSKYAVPFSQTYPEVLVKWATILAGVWIYEPRGQSDENEEGNKLSDLKDDADKEMSEYLAGQKEFTADQPRSHSDMPTAPIAIN